MIASAAIIGVSLIISAAILFVGVTNQRTTVVYVPATSQDLMLELTKRITEQIKDVTEQVKKMPTAEQEQTINTTEAG